MINQDKANILATQYLTNLEERTGIPLQLTETENLPFGWVFFYQSKEYMETNELGAMLSGNAPFIVNANTGKLDVLGTIYPASHYVKEYVKSHQ